MLDRKPPVLGRYECLLPLGRGGMAEVWVARARGARGFEKLLAVKTMLPAMVDDPRFEAMFLDEARLAARIRHPNVTEIFDLGEEDGQLFIAMDWIDGDSLSALSRSLSAPMPLPLALHIAIEAGKGLHAAHELRGADGQLMGLVHRDVSPHNVLLSRSGLVVLSDFGIAKALGRTSRTETGVVKGKPGYMAPEQATGAVVDRRADVFALGVLLYELVTGQHPFRGSNAIETAERLLRQPFVPPSGHLPGLPRELDAAILRAMERDREARYPTVEELGAELARIARSGVGEASSSQLERFLQQHLGASFAERDAELQAALSARPAPPAMRGALDQALTSTRGAVALTDGEAKGSAATQLSLSRGLPTGPSTPPRGRLLAAALLLIGTLAGAGYWWSHDRVAAESGAPGPARPASSSESAQATNAPLASVSAAPAPSVAAAAAATAASAAPLRGIKPSAARLKPSAAPSPAPSSGARPPRVPVRDPGF